MRLALDHLAVSAATLDEGAAWVEAALGVPVAGGGKHPHMGTHNRLLSLGDLYLEVIALDPAAPSPGRPRWFNLDRFQGPPRLTNWICQTDDLARGDYRWRFAVPASGCLPFDDAFPALIQWQGDLHPARALRDHGIRLTRLEITHPRAPDLQTALHGQPADPRVAILTGPHRSIRATFQTPNGHRVLT
jgi:hypothetical protein